MGRPFLLGETGLDLRAVLMGVAFALMWSSAFATARIIVAEASPIFILALRFCFSGLVALALARALGAPLRLDGGLRGAQARAILIFGICQNALYLGLNFVAMQWIEASLAAIIASSMPLIVAALAWVWRGERVSLLGVIGLIAGVGGVVLIMGSRLQGGADALGIALCILASIALAVATLAVQGASGGGRGFAGLLVVVGMQMLVGSAVLAATVPFVETPRFGHSPAFFAAFLYQCFVPGLTATMIWFALVGRIGAIKAATYHFLNPAFGVAVAALLLGELVRPTDMIGVAIAMAGIFAVQISRAQTRVPPSA